MKSVLVWYIWMTVFSVACFNTEIYGFTFISKEVSYDAAKRRCQNSGSKLAKIDSDQKYKEMKEFFSSGYPTQDFWIGLKLNETSYPQFEYMYEDGTPATFLKWYGRDNEPNNQKSEKCIRVTKDSLLFRTMSCSKKYYVLCDNGGSQTVEPNNSYTSTTLVTPKTTLDSDEVAYCGSWIINCSCLQYNFSDPNFQRKLQMKLDKLRRTLVLKSKDLTKAKLKLISLPDKRVTSRCIGAFSGLILASIFLLLALSDIINVFRFYSNRKESFFSQQP